MTSLNLNSFATSESIGEWDDPTAAADGFNLVVRAIAARIDADDFRAEDRMYAAVKAAADLIGSDESLPEMTRERAAEIAERVA